MGQKLFYLFFDRRILYYIFEILVSCVNVDVAHIESTSALFLELRLHFVVEQNQCKGGMCSGSPCCKSIINRPFS